MANWWDTCKNGGCIGYNPSPNCQGYGVSGYRSDYSVPLPYGTPVQSPVNGLVLPDHTSGGGGFYSAYGGQGDTGGEVDMLTVVPAYAPQGRNSVPQTKLVNVGIVHMDSVSVLPGTWVRKGDILGTSGGQNQGGQWPVSPQFSTAPHIGLQVHELGDWCKLLDPAVLMSELTAGNDVSLFPTQDQLNANGLSHITNTPSPGSGPFENPGQAAGTCAPWDIACLLSQLKANFGTLYLFGTQPWRIIKLVFGGALVLLGLVIAFLPDIGAAAVTAAGVPEAAPLVQQALGRSRGPSGVIRGAIRTRGAIQGQKTLKKRQNAGFLERQQLLDKQRRESAQKAKATKNAPGYIPKTIRNPAYKAAQRKQRAPASAPSETAVQGKVIRGEELSPDELRVWDRMNKPNPEALKRQQERFREQNKRDKGGS